MRVHRDRFDAALADRLHRLDAEREQAAAARAWTAIRAAYDARDPLAAGRAAGGDAHRDAAAWAGTDRAAGGGARRRGRRGGGAGAGAVPTGGRGRRTGGAGAEAVPTGGRGRRTGGAGAGAGAGVAPTGGRGRRGGGARAGAGRARRWGVALLVALGGAALALGPAGAKVGDWIGRTFDPPAGRALPADGRLLVSDPTGAWIVQRDLSARWLGAWSTASWSPRGLFVLATRRDLLAALDPRGQVRWTLSRPHVSHAVWSRGDGYRVAYRSRRQLRVVAGDGSGDRALAARTAAVTPAWRPGPAHEHVLAYATPRGGVVVRDVDAVASWEGPTPRPAGWLPSGAPAPALAVPVRRGKPVRAIAWVGRDRLLVLRRDRLDLLALDGLRLATARPPWRGFLGGNLAVGQDGRVAAFVAFDRVRGASELRTVRLDPPPSPRAGGRSGTDRPVRLRTRMRFAGPGGFGAVAISPDGRWAGVWWPAGDRWVFARTTGPRRVTAVGRVSRRLDPGTRARASVSGSPAGVSGWVP